MSVTGFQRRRRLLVEQQRAEQTAKPRRKRRSRATAQITHNELTSDTGLDRREGPTEGAAPDSTAPEPAEDAGER